ncbi:class I SAM-dependent DNA methyltransferase [Endozoicomonas ascidiicola]|uniref:class I SAM-dependent DNA methyltransferase n=1 Tax=Endozoicomonas ascidiicola TaxID=1698521 RepID=UPI000837224D|nr:methyltransferase [Endozoicomonas ascidiicola]
MKQPAEAYYDKLSSVYDQATSVENAWVAPAYMTERMKTFLRPDIDLLEIGIGTGQLSEEILKHENNINITGIDISSSMLDICAKRFPTIKLIHGEVFDIVNNQKTSFQIIAICGTLEFIEDYTHAFAACHSLLKPGGLLAFTYEPVIHNHPIQKEHKSLTVSSIESKYHVPDFYTYRRSPDEISLALEDNGFYALENSEFVPYSKQGIDVIYHCILAEKDEN